MTFRWKEVAQDWDDKDGTLRDLYIEGGDLEDWQRVIDAIRSRGWPSVYYEDNEVVAMPSRVTDICKRFEQVAPTWRVEIRDKLFARALFWMWDMGFDFYTGEVAGQEQFDAVCDFIRLVGVAAGKPVSVCFEGASPESLQDDRIMSYDPATDAFTR
jgi:hypothetical protein